MKFKANYVLDGTISQVWEAREKRFENPEQFPELQKHEEIERKEEGNRIHSKRIVELSASIPKALQKVLSPEMLNCTDESIYDMDTNVHEWTITPNFKTKVFTCTGYSKYNEIEKDGETKTKREVVLEVKVDIPIVGKMAEQVILDAYKKNLEKDNKTMSRMLKIMKEEAK
ncbi:MAG TPA: DUF2505 family protein [bacterium]|nr:DUF2505 family protein [bacterium]